MIRKIGIIGGGASGMVVAIVAARRGLDVTIYEQQEELGKKLLATGNGRCNLTNLFMDESCYYSNQIEIVSQLLKQHSVADVLRFFGEIGVITKDREGYVYPITDQASTVRDALLYELEAWDVNVQLSANVTSIKCIDCKYHITVNDHTHTYEKLVIATGGKSGLHKSIMSTGFSLMNDLKQEYLPISPALVSFQGVGQFFKKIAGVRTNGRVTAMIDGVQLASNEGEIQFTKTGISGIPVFQISRILTQGLCINKKCSIMVDFYPDMDKADMFTFFMNRKDALQNRTVRQFLNGIWKDKLIDLILYIARIPEEACVNQITDEEIKKIIRISKGFEVKLKESDGFVKSQVTAGGISLADVTEQLESKKHPNLYFTGEVLDVDGICGGYNLHFAWISGMIVGEII